MTNEASAHLWFSFSDLEDTLVDHEVERTHRVTANASLAPARACLLVCDVALNGVLDFSLPSIISLAFILWAKDSRSSIVLSSC